MSLTVTLDFPRAQAMGKGGHKGKYLTGSIAFDSSYPTGGESANDITKYFNSCKNVMCEQKAGYLFEFDATNKKIKVMVPFATQANGATAGANNTVVVANSQTEIAGTGTPAQYAGTEVANTANLVALTGVKFLATGY